ncbi:hypothetical protein HA466_0059220 [Hirschfeldia incana]|nr:hypothetical protein HA466_0059220 [Hirschfeldia incana]
MGFKSFVSDMVQIIVAVALTVLLVEAQVAQPAAMPTGNQNYNGGGNPGGYPNYNWGGNPGGYPNYNAGRNRRARRGF